MKKLTSYILLLFCFVAKGQYNSHEIIGKVIETHGLQHLQNVVIAEIDSSIVEYTMSNIKSGKKVFKSISSNSKIKLSESEKSELISSMRKQYTEIWTSEDFHNLKVINKSEILEYVRSDKENGYIYITNPIFIRNDTIALVFFANFYGELDKSGGGINNLSFYKLVNGNWEQWITLEAGIYN